MGTFFFRFAPALSERLERANSFKSLSSHTLLNILTAFLVILQIVNIQCTNCLINLKAKKIQATQNASTYIKIIFTRILE